MRFFGESRSRAHAPADKPRDAEAMDAAAAKQVDAQDAKRRAEAGIKPKHGERDAPEVCPPGSISPTSPNSTLKKVAK